MPLGMFEAFKDRNKEKIKEALREDLRIDGKDHYSLPRNPSKAACVKGCDPNALDFKEAVKKTSTIRDRGVLADNQTCTYLANTFIFPNLKISD
jgi:hypothetical protein